MIVFYNSDTLINFDGSSGTPAGTYEFFNCRTHSSYDDYGYYYSSNTTWSFNGRTSVFRDKTKPGDFEGSQITSLEINYYDVHQLALP